MSKLTVTLPDDLHAQIRQELEEQGITTGQFIEMVVTKYFTKDKKGENNMATTCLDCMWRAPTLTFWCANRASSFARVLEPFCERQVREMYTLFCSPFGAPKPLFKKSSAAGAWTV